jgi:hypothetical protein
MARKLIKITSRGIIKILLSSGCIAKVRNMLYMPRIRNITLLLTQALQDVGIWNEHVEKTYQFFKKRGDILAKGYNIGWTSYLGWVSHKSALASGHENQREEESAYRVKAIDWELLYKWFGYPGKAQFKRMTKELGLAPEEEVLEELKTCETCIQAKSIKKQSHVKVPRASRPLKRVYMDF